VILKAPVEMSVPWSHLSLSQNGIVGARNMETLQLYIGAELFRSGSTER